jgi:hypothetical protein
MGLISRSFAVDLLTTQLGNAYSINGENCTESGNVLFPHHSPASVIKRRSERVSIILTMSPARLT